MKKIMNLISWASVYVIIAAIGIVSIVCGSFVAQAFVDFFKLSGCWCLLGIFPLFFVGLAVAFFFISGLKKFGGE